MDRTIRIGTRSSELALWQAKLVAKKLEEIEGLSLKTEIVKIESQGDLVLDKPLHELGITGVFTKSLDVALLKGKIDIAVHSMKDVPTVLPKGIVQAAVLKRAGSLDVIVPKGQTEEFMTQRHATIATGSLRRKAQWLHHFPEHTIVGLRGNVQTRMSKLENSDWDGAIFAQAGLQRVKLLPKNHIKLDWMVPAPAQGIVMVTALEVDDRILEVCKELNHKETAICAHIERQFLNTLEGGCTAPIGALAFFREEKIVFKGALFSLDGKRKIDIDKSCYLVEHKDLGKVCAESVLERGGKRLMDEIAQGDKEIKVLSTKQLSLSQTDSLADKIGCEMSDFIAVRYNRLKPTIVKNKIQNVVLSSQNAVESLLQSFSPIELDFVNIYCVGRRTKRLIERKIKKVSHVENSAKELANYLSKQKELKEVTYFCGDIRRDELQQILASNNITVNEVEVYRTMFNERKFTEDFKGVMFYSPSGVQSFINHNQVKEAVAFCIGETTAAEASKYFNEVKVAKTPSIESVLKLVNQYYE